MRGLKRKQVNEPEKFLRDLTGRHNVILTGRASAALWAVLRAKGFSGQSILIPANECYIVAWAILQSGNLPRLIDVDPRTGNISLDTLSIAHVDSPAALMICHTYGLGAPIAPLIAWAKRRGIFVIEDATLALGAQVDDRPAGSWGDVSLCSFGEGKIADVGLGGALLCDDPGLATQVQADLETLPPWSECLAQLRNQWTELYWVLHQHEKTNPHLATLYPALFKIFGDITRHRLPDSVLAPLAQAFSSLQANLDQRLKMTALYDEYFRFMQVRTLVRPRGSVVWRYPLLVAHDERDALLQQLWQNDVVASRWYPPLDPMLAALVPGSEQHASPGAEQLGAQIINLPVDHAIDEAAIRRTAEIIQAYFRKAKHADRSKL